MAVGLNLEAGDCVLSTIPGGGGVDLQWLEMGMLSETLSMMHS